MRAMMKDKTKRVEVLIKILALLKVPDGLDLAAAAPLLCAGITTYSPLHHWKVGPGQKVGVVGLGLFLFGPVKRLNIGRRLGCVDPVVAVQCVPARQERADLIPGALVAAAFGLIASRRADARLAAA